MPTGVELGSASSPTSEVMAMPSTGRRPSETGSPASMPTTALATEPPDRLRSALHVLGSVVAPTSLLTALLIFFGRQHARHFFDYFGIDLSLLELTTQDYLIRSTDALFVPLTVGLSIALVLVWLNARLSAQIFDGPRATKHLLKASVGTAVVGLFLFAAGTVRVVFGFPASFSLAFPLSLGSGTLLLLYAAGLYRRAQPSHALREYLSTVALFEATGAFFLVGLSLFWAAGNYSAAVGEVRASQFAEEFTATLPRSVVYSTDRLHLDAVGVREVLCGEPGSEQSFRYDGMRLMLRSGGQYFFLPDAWSPAGGAAIVIPEGGNIRLQFAMPPKAATSQVSERNVGC